MRKVLLSVIAVLALGVVPAASAGGPYMFVGAADDVVVQRDPVLAKSRTDLAKLAGLDTLRLSVQWSRGQTELEERAAEGLENAVAAASLDGIRIVLSLYPFGSSVTPLTDSARADFAAWATDVVKRFPSVRDFVVGNEPNLNRFWLPQFGEAGEDVAAPAYLTLLAQTYDAIKAVRPQTTVYGGALAPRGADRPNTGRDTHSPTAFIQDLGVAYRASGRAVPVMDAFAFHPYADASNVPPGAAHPNTTAIGIGDYGKLVALLGRAFDGTAQRGSTLPILYDEFGVESDIPAAKLGLYTGTEAATVHPVDETTQALYYNQALQLTFCQPNVIGLLLFHALDEPARSGWQSGLYYADGTAKSSITLTRNAADATRRGIIAECPGLELTPKLTVSTTRTAVRGKVKVTLASTLDATYTLGLRRVGGGAPPVTLRGIILGRRTATLRVPAKLRPGAYRWRAVATATQNVGPQFSRLAGAFTVR